MPSRDNRQRYDLQIYRGADYCKDAWVKTTNEQGQKVAYDITGWTAKAEIRPSQNSTVLTQTITCDITPLEGKITLQIIGQDTAKIAPGIYFWDLKTSFEGSLCYYVYGKVYVEGRVTE